MKNMKYFKSFGKFAIGYHKTPSGRWWHNIKPRLIDGKKFKSMRYDCIFGISRVYFRGKGLYVYNITIFSHSFNIGPVKRK